MTNPLVHAMLILFIWAPFALLAAVEDRLTPELFRRARLAVTHPLRELHAYRLHHDAPAH